jgi:hypothetical protein
VPLVVEILIPEAIAQTATLGTTGRGVDDADDKRHCQAERPGDIGLRAAEDK